MKKKSIIDKFLGMPKFWKIYIFVITLIIIASSVFFLIFSLNLRKYEQTSAAERREREREAEISRQIESDEAALREFEEKSSAELSAAEALSKRSRLLSEIAEAEKSALTHVSVSLDSKPEKVMDALMTELSRKGSSCLQSVIGINIGKYEDISSVFRYIDAVQGEYSYEKKDELSYTVRKGGLSLDARLSEGAPDEAGHKTYSLSSVSVIIPLHSYRTEMPENAVLKINGRTVTETPAIKKREVSVNVPSSFEIPSVASYSFDGFVYRPHITAELDGAECVKVDYEDKFVFRAQNDGAYKTLLSDRICTLAFMYSDFVAGDFKFDVLKPYLYPSTVLYRGLEDFDNRWYYDYTSIENANAKITDFTVISDRLISVHIEYEQLLYRGTKVHKRIPFKFDIYVGCGKSADTQDPESWRLVSVEGA